MMKRSMLALAVFAVLFVSGISPAFANQTNDLRTVTEIYVHDNHYRYVETICYRFSDGIWQLADRYRKYEIMYERILYYNEHEVLVGSEVRFLEERPTDYYRNWGTNEPCSS